MLKMTVKIIPAVAMRAVERVVCASMQGASRSRVPSARAESHLARRDVSRLYCLLYSYKELCAYAVRVCTHHNILSSAVNF